MKAKITVRSALEAAAFAKEKAAVRRWLEGHAAVRIRKAAAEEGPNPGQTVAEAHVIDSGASTRAWHQWLTAKSDKAVIELRPHGFVREFSFSILRPLSRRLTSKEVLRIEGHYKKKLRTRAFGLNEN